MRDMTPSEVHHDSFLCVTRRCGSWAQFGVIPHPPHGILLSDGRVLAGFDIGASARSLLSSVYTAIEASWWWVFDPYVPLWFDLYHSLRIERHIGINRDWSFFGTDMKRNSAEAVGSKSSDDQVDDRAERCACLCGVPRP